MFGVNFGSFELLSEICFLLFEFAAFSCFFDFGVVFVFFVVLLGM